MGRSNVCNCSGSDGKPRHLPSAHRRILSGDFDQSLGAQFVTHLLIGGWPAPAYTYAHPRAYANPTWFYGQRQNRVGQVLWRRLAKTNFAQGQITDG